MLKVRVFFFFYFDKRIRLCQMTYQNKQLFWIFYRGKLIHVPENNIFWRNYIRAYMHAHTNTNTHKLIDCFIGNIFERKSIGIV